MKVLALETSSMVASVAVVSEHKLIAEYVLNHTKTHSQILMPMVEKVLDSANLTPADIDVFAAASGPGSFTGIRIGVATVKALAQAVGRPVVGVSGLDGLAFNLAFAQGLICPIMDARREQVYTGVYRWSEDCIERIHDYMAIRVTDLIEMLSEMNEQVVFCGDGVPQYKEIIRQRMGNTARFALPTCMRQRASSIAWLAIQKAISGETQHYNDLQPFYLRKPQAEQKLLEHKTGTREPSPCSNTTKLEHGDGSRVPLDARRDF